MYRLRYLGELVLEGLRFREAVFQSPPGRNERLYALAVVLRLLNGDRSFEIGLIANSVSVLLIARDVNVSEHSHRLFKVRLGLPLEDVRVTDECQVADIDHGHAFVCKVVTEELCEFGEEQACWWVKNCGPFLYHQN